MHHPLRQHSRIPCDLRQKMASGVEPNGKDSYCCQRLSFGIIASVCRLGVRWTARSVAIWKSDTGKFWASKKTHSNKIFLYWSWKIVQCESLCMCFAERRSSCMFNNTTVLPKNDCCSSLTFWYRNLFHRIGIWILFLARSGIALQRDASPKRGPQNALRYASHPRVIQGGWKHENHKPPAANAANVSCICARPLPARFCFLKWFRSLKLVWIGLLF